MIIIIKYDHYVVVGVFFNQFLLDISSQGFNIHLMHNHTLETWKEHQAVLNNLSAAD